MAANTISSHVDINNFLSELDYSKAIDVLNGNQKIYFKYNELISAKDVIFCDTFICTEIFKKVRVILTKVNLIFCAEDNCKKYYLLYTPIENQFISIRTIHTDREIIGEYNIQFWIHQQKIFTMKANTKEVRNMWLGVDKNSSLKDQASLWKPLIKIVESNQLSHSAVVTNLMSGSTTPKPVRQDDIFTTYTDPSGEISPLVSSDDESDEDVNSWFEKKDQALSALVDQTDKTPSLDKSSIISSSSSSVHSSFLKEKSLPPIPTSKIFPQLPLELPTKPYQPTNTTSIRHNQSPIPSKSFLSNMNNTTPETIDRPSNTRSYSAYPYNDIQQISQESSVSSPPKRSSFMKSVISVMSKSRSSFIQSTKSTETEQPIIKPGANASSVSLDQQTKKKAANDPLRRYSAAPSASATTKEPPVPPKHIFMPKQQNIYSSSFNRSTPTFSTSQSNSSITPPHSRSSSPGSTLTPIAVNRYQTSSSSSSEDLGTPPESPEIVNINNRNTIKSVLYKNDQFQVFHWKDDSWYAVEEKCILEVRQTFSSRSCVAVHMKNTGQLYLNAWILPDTLITRTNDTDLSISLHITSNHAVMDDYLFHCESKIEADKLNQLLETLHQESIKMNSMTIPATSTLRGAPPELLNNPFSEDLAKPFKLAMQCKCKLFVQSASSKWSSFGSVYMKVSQHYGTKKMHIAMESLKGGKTTQLVSAMVQSHNVERLGPKRISFMMMDEESKNCVVYMIQVREELTGDKILEYIKTKNAENGW